jgi:hypothetical protein
VRSGVNVPRPAFGNFFIALSCFLYFGLGCSGGGSQGGSNESQNPIPTLASVSPNSAVAGSAGLAITATGSGFVTSSVVEWNGAALATTYVSGTSLTAQVPASDLSSTGTASVAVQTPAPGGGTSASLSFAITPVPNPAPTINSLSPSGITVGGPAFTLTVTGSQFVSSSQVLWNGAALATTYVSGTSLAAQVPASDIGSTGSASVAVQTPAPGGGTSTSLSFAINPAPNPAPAITSLSPSGTMIGGPAFTLTVTGSQFVSGSQVLWNGAALATTYVSSTSLAAQVPASDLSSASTATVAVQTPAPGGGTSSNLTFTISPPATSLNVLNLAGKDLAWNSSQQKLYVAVPGSASANPGTITVVDPIAGSIVSSQQLSSAASGLALSDDNQYLYSVIGAGATIQRLVLPALTSDIQWSLGTGSTSGKANLAGDIKVQPGAAHTVAVSMGQYGSGVVAVFDDGVQRPTVAGSALTDIGNSLQWKPDGTGLYAVYTDVTDSGYYTSNSENPLSVMSVNQAGVSLLNTYNAVLRNEGAHLQIDSTTGYVYGDWGEVINPTNGIPIGNFQWNRPSGTYAPGPLSVVDPSLKRFYTLLEVSGPGNTFAFQIQVFDQIQFRLLSTIVIPNGIGTPANFIRWGQAGLAFVTNGGSSTGALYILDGGFVNPSGIQDTSAGTALNPVPALTGISPVTATAGSGSVTLTVTGHDFVGQPTVYWNGTALPTSMVNSTELQVQIPASDLTTVNQNAITASNETSGNPVSNSLPFAVNPAPPTGNQVAVYSTGGNGLVWDANAGKIYVSMPGAQGDQGDSIGIVDPVDGTVTNSGFLGSDPANLSISSDGKLLYVALYGQNAIQQLTLPNIQVNNSWNLGSDSFSGPYYALDLQAAPGAPQTTAVTLANFNRSPSSASVVIYDGATPRPTQLPSSRYSYSSLQWAGNNTTLYTVDQSVPEDFLTLGVGSTGVTLSQHYDRILNSYSPNIHYDSGTGLIYADGGQVIQPSNGSIVSSYGASGMTVPDSTLGRVFILGQTSAQSGTANYTIQSFDQTKFTAIGSITINNVVGKPTGFIRWGSNGLAFTTRVGQATNFTNTGPGQLYVISGDFVNHKCQAVFEQCAVGVRQEDWARQAHDPAASFLLRCAGYFSISDPAGFGGLA